MPKIERRDLAGQRIEARRSSAPEAGGLEVSGVIPYNSPSGDLGGFREIIAPSAFTRTLNARSDVKLLWSHDEAEVLGSSAAGTLRLESKPDGLHFRATLPASAATRAEALTRGDVTGVSFGFTVDPQGATLDAAGPEIVRTLRSVHLVEVSLVAWPAYPESGVNPAKRSVDPAPDKEAERLRLELELLRDY